MTECGKNGHKCKNNIRRKYKKLYDKNRQEKFIVLGIDFIICFACVVLWVGVNTWVLVVYCMAGFMS
jgi:t-SNARE complex subunit (syntaxin)